MALVLIADDSPTDQHILSRALQQQGFETVTAEDGEEAIRLAEQRTPDVILMDIVMPGMDGYQACRKLAVDPLTRAIPVVFVSTKCQRADQVWARMQGGKALIGKPFSDAQVLDALRFAVR